MAQVINMKKLEEENEKLKEDIMVLQDTINRIDDRLRSLFGIDNFGYKDLSMYEKFCGDKKYCDDIIEHLKNITDLCDNTILILNKLFNNRHDEWN